MSADYLWGISVGANFKEAMFWHVQWITQGWSGSGYYNMTRNRSRFEYQKSIKYINKNKDLIKRVNFLNAAMEGDKNQMKIQMLHYMYLS